MKQRVLFKILKDGEFNLSLFEIVQLLYDEQSINNKLLEFLTSCIAAAPAPEARFEILDKVKHYRARNEGLQSLIDRIQPYEQAHLEKIVNSCGEKSDPLHQVSSEALSPRPVFSTKTIVKSSEVHETTRDNGEQEADKSKSDRAELSEMGGHPC
jgi:hypothetical protein